MTIIAPFLLLFVALVLLAWSGLLAWSSYRQKVYAFKASLVPAQNHMLGGSSLVSKLVAQDIAECFRYMWGIGSIMQLLQKRYSRLLTQAGNPGLLVGDEYFLIKVLSAILGTLPIIAVGTISSKSILGGWCIFLFLLPDYLLKARAKARKEQAKLALPAALESWAFMLKNGIRFPEALQLYVGRKSWSPLQNMIYPLLGNTPSVLEQLFNDLNLKEFSKSAKIIDRLEEDPSQKAEALKHLAKSMKAAFLKKMHSRFHKKFPVLALCFFGFIIPSLAILLFAPILFDYYPIITSLLLTW